MRGTLASLKERRVDETSCARERTSIITYNNVKDQ